MRRGDVPTPWRRMGRGNAAARDQHLQGLRVCRLRCRHCRRTCPFFCPPVAAFPASTCHGTAIVKGDALRFTAMRSCMRSISLDQTMPIIMQQPFPNNITAKSVTTPLGPPSQLPPCCACNHQNMSVLGKKQATECLKQSTMTGRRVLETEHRDNSQSACNSTDSSQSA